MNIWESILDDIRPSIPAEDFRRWFGETAYASDSGDLITVWVPSEAIRRHLRLHYEERVRRSLHELGRTDCDVRFVVGGTDDEDDFDERE